MHLNTSTPSLGENTEPLGCSGAAAGGTRGCNLLRELRCLLKLSAHQHQQQLPARGRSPEKTSAVCLLKHVRNAESSRVHCGQNLDTAKMSVSQNAVVSERLHSNTKQSTSTTAKRNELPLTRTSTDKSHRHNA